MARLTAEQWEEVKADWATGHYSLAELSKMHSVSNAAISKKATAEAWQKLDPKTVETFVSAKSEMVREVNKISEVNKVNAVNLLTSIDRLGQRKAKAEDVGDKLIQAFGDAIPACESPSDLKDLATGFKAVYEPMFKTNPDTAIQFNQTTEQQPKTIRILRAGTELVEHD
jgi:hypothetical protein